MNKMSVTMRDIFKRDDMAREHAWLIIVQGRNGNYDESDPKIFAKAYVEGNTDVVSGQVAGQPKKGLDVKMSNDFDNFPCYIGFEYNKRYHLLRLIKLELVADDNGDPIFLQNNNTARMYKFTATRVNFRNIFQSRSEMMRIIDDDNLSTEGVIRLIRKGSSEYLERYAKHTANLYERLRGRFTNEEELFEYLINN